MTSMEKTRFQSLDILRGFALLGLLSMNFIAFAMPISAYFNPNAYMPGSWLNMPLFSLMHVLADQKFMGIFSLLFGASVIMIIQGAEAKGEGAGKLHFKRNFWLIIFGLLHGIFLWEGDVLLVYGLCALPLYFFRNLRSIVLLPLGVIIYLSSTFYFINTGVDIAQLDQAGLDWLENFWAPTQDQISEQISIYQGDYATQLQERLDDADTEENAGENLFMLGLVVDGFSRAFGMMLIGMAAFKTGIIIGQKSESVYFRMCIGGFVCGLPIVLFGMYLSYQNGFSATFGLFEGRIANHFASLFMVAGYVGLINFIIKKSVMTYLQALLASVGKLALTNYLSQTLIASFIFYGWGLGLYGELSRGQVFMIIPCIWLLQISFSVFWLKHFVYGPVEWLWRSLTHFYFAPLRKIK